jgi:hypothetical protein
MQRRIAPGLRTDWHTVALVRWLPSGGDPRKSTYPRALWAAARLALPLWYPTIGGLRSATIGEVNVRLPRRLILPTTRTNCSRRRMNEMMPDQVSAMMPVDQGTGPPSGASNGVYPGGT